MPGRERLRGAVEIAVEGHVGAGIQRPAVSLPLDIIQHILDVLALGDALEVFERIIRPEGQTGAQRSHDLRHPRDLPRPGFFWGWSQRGASRGFAGVSDAQFAVPCGRLEGIGLCTFQHFAGLGVDRDDLVVGGAVSIGIGEAQGEK